MLVYANKSQIAWSKVKHVHGEADIQAAFEEKKGIIYLKLPLEIIAGFEHEPRNETQQKQFDESIRKLQNQAKLLFTLPDSCTYTNIEFKKSANIGGHDGHQDIIITYTIECTQSIKDQSFSINIQNIYPRTKKIEVDLLSPNQTHKMIVKKPITIKL